MGEWLGSSFAAEVRCTAKSSGGQHASHVVGARKALGRWQLQERLLP